MKKIAIISHCDECPHCDNYYYSYNGTCDLLDDKYVMDCVEDIHPDCPLKNAEEEENTPKEKSFDPDDTVIITESKVSVRWGDVESILDIDNNLVLKLHDGSVVPLYKDIHILRITDDEVEEEILDSLESKFKVIDIIDIIQMMVI